MIVKLPMLKLQVENVNQDVLQVKHGMEITVSAQKVKLDMDHVKNAQLAQFLILLEQLVFVLIQIKSYK